MKNLKMGIIALVLGGGIALTQSSFRVAQTDTRWGYVQGDGTFVDITGKTEDNSAHPASGTFSCASSSNICNGLDNSTPTSPGDLTDTETGDFSLN